MMKDVKFGHQLKASSPIDDTLFGMSMDVNLHHWNARTPMLVTPMGMFVFVQPNNSLFVAVSIIALQLSRES